MVLYVRELDASEKARLQSWLNSDDPELKHRARVVLLSADGYRIPEIAQIVESHPANLRKWIHRFNQMGCRGLRTVRSGGAKPRFTETQKKRIVALARSRPRELGLNFTSWTLHKLAEQAEKQRIVDQISHEYVRQILKAANCSYKHAIR
ncbi:MAG: helix-turn-helix domain containing protein [Chloroflexi bacterium]|jgi:transposase|nr:helix-turn-helix domain containing protein [Chloroflexota bacterium]